MEAVKEAREAVWLEDCRICGKKHKWTMAPCPSCRIHWVPVLVSENTCYHDEDCDGCRAYRDHMR